MSEDRECTCHPDEAPVPCRKKYAFTECENEQLREENARYKLTYAKYVEATDRMNGTPCEQIRHQQEVEALREENARLREALEGLQEIIARKYEIGTDIEGVNDE